MAVRFVLITLSLIVLIHPLLVNTWAKDVLTTVTVHTDIDVENALAPLAVEDTIAQEAVADPGLAKFCIFQDIHVRRPKKSCF